MKKSIWIIAVIIVIAALLIIKMLTGGQKVEVIQVESGDIRTWVEDTAYVQARDEIVIQANQSGKIVRITVETGQKVNAGQELLVIENLDLKYQQDAASVLIEQLQGELSGGQIILDQARQNQQEAQKTLQRNEQLFQSGAISQVEYDVSAQQNLTLQKVVERQTVIQQSLRRQLEKQNTLYQDLTERNQQLVVKSPVAGTVLDLPAKKEQTVITGNELVQIGSEGALELKTELLSDDIGAVELGQKVEISAAILGETVLNGQVTKIYPRAYEKVSALGVIQRRVPVIISLPEQAQLQPGYEVQVKIETNLKPNVITLPRMAIRVNAQGENEVLAVVQGRIRHIKIQTGIKNPEMVEIRSGLKAGQSVVRDGSTDFEENTRVKI